jgi:hypothetical protein
MKIKDLLEKEVKSFSDETSGFKKYPRAKFTFTKERAEEFSRVSIEDLLDDPYFLNMKYQNGQGLYPSNKDIILSLEEERSKRVINTFVYTGSIGAGKTTLLGAIFFIEVFKLIIIPDLCKYYNLTPNSTFAFIVLSRDAEKAKKVTFKKFLPMFANAGFFQDYFPLHVSLDKITENPRTMPNELRFPKDILLFPGSGSSASSLGHNIFCGGADESNDMERIEKSKKSVIKSYYDAAEEASNEILNRMDSRFPWNHLHREGKRHGVCVFIGQTRGPDSFLEKKIREAQALGKESTIFYVRKSIWEAKPREFFSKEEFICDKSNNRVVDFIKPEEKDLSDSTCSVCGRKLFRGAFVANNGKLVCTENFNEDDGYTFDINGSQMSLTCYYSTFSKTQKEEDNGTEVI